MSTPPSAGRTEVDSSRPEAFATVANVKDYTNIIIGWILLGGVTLSALVILAGVALLLLQPGKLGGQDLQMFPHSVSEVWAGLLALQPQAVIVLGLLLLIATPVMRVAVSIVAFAVEGDRLYVVITLIVLAILITSFLLGKGG